MNTETNIPATLSAMGFTLETSQPSPGVDKDDGKAWPHIAYTVTLKKDGKQTWYGPYKLGVEHVKIPSKTSGGLNQMMFRLRLTGEEECALTALQNNPRATLANPALHASIAAKLANVQNVVPKLEDVIYSLLLDGSAFFDGCTFEDWVWVFGYDTDSRKAESIFQTCDAIGRELVRNLGRETVEELRDIFQDY